MASRTATLRLQLIDSVSGPAKGAAGALSSIDKALAKFGKGGTPEVKRLVKQLEYLQKKSGAIEDFTSNRRGLKQLSVEMRAAQSTVKRLSDVLAQTAKPTAAMKRELKTAENALRTVTNAFRQQGAAVRQAEAGLRSFGINGRTNISRSQQQIRDELAKTIRTLRKLDAESRKPPPPKPPMSQRPPPSSPGSPVRDAFVAAGGATAANYGRTAAEKAFFSAIDFNQATAYQAALGSFNKDERGALNRQAEKIGGDTRFTNVDVVQAQTTILQRGIRDTKVIMDLTTKVTDYALAMGVTLDEAAEAVTGSALSKRIDLKDTKAIGNFVDFLVWMAKNGGMSNEDVSQFVKYGGAPTTGAKLPDEYMAAMGMILRRSGVRGDEAGVFARSAASKLVAPTKKGRDALAAMGIDYNKYTTIDAMNTEGVGIALKNNFGVRMTQEMRDQMKELIDNGEFTAPETGETRSVISDSGEFVTRASEIVGPLFQNKDGKVPAADAKALAKMLSDYQKYSVDSVDATGLLEAIAASNPTLGNLNAFFTDRQGGRANMIFQQWPLFVDMLNKMRNVPAGVANDIGTKANAELYGDWTKMVGTWETVLTRVGQDFEGVTRPIINTLNSVGDGFLSLDQATRQVVAGMAGLAAALAGFAAFRAGAGLLGRVIGGGAAGAAGAGAGAAGGAATAAGAGIASKSLPLALTLGTALLTREAIRRLSEQYAADEKKAPAVVFDQGEDANRANYQRQFHGVQFEGGWHRVGRGAAPAPGQPSPYGEYKSSAGGGSAQKAEGGGDTNISAPVSAPVNITMNGVMLNEVMDAVRKAAAEVATSLTRSLDAQLNRSSQTQFGGVKPYGDE